LLVILVLVDLILPIRMPLFLSQNKKIALIEFNLSTRFSVHPLFNQKKLQQKLSGPLLQLF
ncbi:hypothetical protein P7H75_01920, partial [Vagococcus carniphilus]|uniref:hypothetical protein n=1 Tax=Vagococcus carniphilus TaxID=218144 RepID=UPI002890B9C7